MRAGIFSLLVSFLLIFFVSASFSAPTINSVYTNGSNFTNARVYLIANVSDSNLTSVNFTVLEPDGTFVINDINGTNSSGGANLNSIWNSTSFVLSRNGTYNFTVRAVDRLGGITNISGNISFIIANATLSTFAPRTSTSFNITGRMNFTNGTAVGNVTVNVYVDNLIQYDFGDGTDGNLTVPAAFTVINTYTSLVGNASLGATSFTVADATGFSIGDEILIIQMQNATSGSGSTPQFSAGSYEFVQVASIATNTLTFDSALINAYFTNSTNTTNASVAQVIRVPNYNNLTILDGASITTSVWNGTTGGVVVFRALNLNISSNSSINVNATGFRGGNNSYTSNTRGGAGESIWGLGPLTSNSRNYGGGGGGGNPGVTGSGGAGGGYGAAGSQAAITTATAGLTYGGNNLSVINLGSGGGSGGLSSAGAEDIKNGGVGGGIVFIAARNITINGFINASGQAGLNAVSAGAAGGGGSGGTIYIITENASIGANLLQAAGGAAGDSSNDGHDGGAGGGGRIRIDYINMTGSVASTFYGTYLNSTNSSFRTNSSGHYNIRIVAPVIGGFKSLKVNITYDNLYGENIQNLSVNQTPLINGITTNMSNHSGAQIYLIADVADENVRSINFTITAPNGTSMINNVNGSNNAGTGWNSTPFNLSVNGTYNWSIAIYDNSGNNVNISGNVSFIIITKTLNPVGVSQNFNVTLSGFMNLSNETNITDELHVYINGTEYFRSVFGDGRHGNLTVTALGTVVNNYTNLLGNVTANNTIITVADSTAFSVGDEILIIQTQNGTYQTNGSHTNSTNAGTYEFKIIIAKSGPNLTLHTRLNNSYQSNSSNTTNASVVQIVRIPNYNNVTIESGASIVAPLWNGTSGGIVMFRVLDFLNVTGNINVNATGFRAGTNPSGTRGGAGESIWGVGPLTSNPRNFGGGGGGGNPSVTGSGGAGGGYGLQGFNAAIIVGVNGTTYGSNTLSVINLGSGGGAGGSSGTETSMSGGAGGGIVFIAARNITVNGFINASGQAGVGSGATPAGGGGSGGSVYIIAVNASIGTNLLQAAGGAAGDSSNDGHDGGAGGGGRIKIDYFNLTGAVSSTYYGTSHNSTYTTNSSILNFLFYSNASGHYSFNLSAPGSRGVHPVKINVSSLNLYGEVSRSLAVGPDTVFPSLTVALPVNNTNSSSTSVVLNFSVSDDLILDSCWYSLDQGATNSTLSGCSNTTITFGTGARNITVYANDSFNNVNSSGLLNVNVDQVNPSLTVQLPVNNSNYSTNSVVLNYTPTDSLTAINSCWYSLNNGTSNTTIASCANTTITPGGGISYVTVYTNDTVNNVNASGQLKVVVDLVSPILNGTNPLKQQPL